MRFVAATVVALFVTLSTDTLAALVLSAGYNIGATCDEGNTADGEGCSSASLNRASGASLEYVGVTNTEITVQISNPMARNLSVVEVPIYAQYDPMNPGAPIYTGTGEGAFSIPRFDGNRDRYYAAFQMIDAADKGPIGVAQHVSDLSGLDRTGRQFGFPTRSSIKGLLAAHQGESDAVALGVRHIGFNVGPQNILDLGNPNPRATWDVDGQAIPVNVNFLNALDGVVRFYTDAGVSVTFRFSNQIGSNPDPGNPLVHPDTDISAPRPLGFGAFNLTDEQGYRHLRAAVEILAERYSNPGGNHGWAPRVVVGNEVDMHWDWYNIGLMSESDFQLQYERALRLVDLALRKYHDGFRVYISQTLFWNDRAPWLNDLQSVTSRSLIEGLNALTKARGDFPWGIAKHPYPYPLGEPRFWTETDSTLSFDASIVTPNNFEIVPAFLRQEHLLFAGQPRGIALDEQGFHTPGTSDGEEIQAAAFAYAFHKFRNMPEIETFTLFRQQDNSFDLGLRPGLWTQGTRDTPGVFDPTGQKKLIYDVFRFADTPGWRNAFAFALPIIGRASWDDALPARTRINFQFNADTEGWVASSGIRFLNTETDQLAGMSTNADPLLSHAYVFLVGSMAPRVYLRLTTSAGTRGTLFWTTSSQATYSQAFTIVGDGEPHLYELDLSDHVDWIGEEILELGFRPMNAAGDFKIDFIVAPSIVSDLDNDGANDIAESGDDLDKDTFPNFLDPDSDGDGVPDAIEFQLGTDAYDPFETQRRSR